MSLRAPSEILSTLVGMVIHAESEAVAAELAVWTQYCGMPIHMETCTLLVVVITDVSIALRITSPWV
jgi:hypothetical protein